MKKEPPRQEHEITQLLAAWREGNQTALDELYPLVYDELHRLARRYMSRERKGHTLQTTALINEAYVRLVDQRNVQWANRSHFFAISAQIMRRILIDHARRHAYAKRGGGARQVSLDETATVINDDLAEFLRLDEALKSLAELDPRRSQVVELKYFGGLNNDEIAGVLKISKNTVIRDWNMARAWLHSQLAGSASN
ncbi:MAG TPA: sigma-70 family RNA polymerase sigma factor [Pyrinomonadaceae bacterium]|jgi:RNA polymerase sigma factor (TIGR02999 family)|nr:sigma-70 family RNA polymerase sigma factor [Pyrinomonadaceae bacterium]